MDEVNELLSRRWDAEQWIREGWDELNAEERQLIKTRMHDMFKDGLPFELNHDKIIYLYTFSLLAQLEVLAIQIPLRFEKSMSNPEFKQKMRAQLLDEVFHGLVFTKIVYLLSVPYALPPEYNQAVEQLCHFIRTEQCPKTGFILLNLVAESWIEELFRVLHQENIAPRVFSTILEDESRHVSEADLYCEIGLPNLNQLKKKLETFEELLSSLFQEQYLYSLQKLIGIQTTDQFLQTMIEKHARQLRKLGLTPGVRWQNRMQLSSQFFSQFMRFLHADAIPLTPLRQLFLKQAKSSSQATMVGQFNLNTSTLTLADKKYQTIFVLQAISQVMMEIDELRCYVSHQKIYRTQDALVSLVVKLPECNDQLSYIVFKNAHLMDATSISAKIKQAIQIMSYCYQRRERIESARPEFKQTRNQFPSNCSQEVYPYPRLDYLGISLSNVGPWGYTQAVTPLFNNDSGRFIILAEEQRTLLNHKTQALETMTQLPISLSFDHRVSDGNKPIPKLLNEAFQTAYERMKTNKSSPVNSSHEEAKLRFSKTINKYASHYLDDGHRIFSLLQTVWIDGIDFEKLNFSLETTSSKFVFDKEALSHA